jgi:Tir chaperone protein (CesT) family
MADDFRSIMTQLWASLGLRAPSFGPEASIVLNIDGIDVTLSESADGRHVVVASTVGRLSADPQRRSEQVRQLLKANLGFLQSNAACLSLASTEAAAPVRVEAIYPYRAARLGQLTGLIEDVLHRVEVHAMDLAAGPVAATARPQTSHPAFTAVSQEDFIFRP